MKDESSLLAAVEFLSNHGTFTYSVANELIPREMAASWMRIIHILANLDSCATWINTSWNIEP